LPQQNILDVGGRPGLLEKFIAHPVTVSNLSEGDIISNGLFLPFADSSFEIVTSLDVLEHVPSVNRARFIAELFRVAKSQVIFCAPLGTSAHIQQEKDIAVILRSKGMTNLMLEEHVMYGIPSLQEVLACLPAHSNHRLIYTGDFRFNSLLFKMDQRIGNMRILKPMGVMISLILNLFGNLLVYPFCLSSKPHQFTNRLTAVITKEL
jgi:hypothetical protein